ncbi:GTPase [Streptomyces sp. TS71-3]|uniref:GTPase n=1 Tax=Streptomyces sp. TS71-3 TaxID=2733862 RepID=UPI001BB3D6B6|nr:GTPase [Streptomyces sp. TS71-3]
MSTESLPHAPVDRRAVLSEATAAAVERSRPVARELQHGVETVVAKLAGHLDALPPEGDPDGLHQLAGELVDEVCDELEELIGDRVDGLDAFNIVLFGRTGAGKSSLMEALSHGDGGSISPWGAADWSTDVRPTTWQTCWVFDTPGIAGWGRTMARADLCGSKRSELAMALDSAAALARIGAKAAPERVLCVASDPYGLQGSAREHFDAFRHWDGMDEFEEAFARLRPALLANGVDVSLLHGGLARLGGLVRTAQEESAAARERGGRLGSLRAEAADQLREGAAIRSARADRLEFVVGEFLDRELGKAMRSKNADERRALAGRLEQWIDNTELRAPVGAWHAETTRESAAWERTAARTLKRRLDSRGFQTTFPDAGEKVSLGFLSGHRGKKRARTPPRAWGGSASPSPRPTRGSWHASAPCSTAPSSRGNWPGVRPSWAGQARCSRPRPVSSIWSPWGSAGP